ncbi:MAG: cell division protein ZapA [Candidatus Dependentiae bacterium]|nr:cell division protein ZapA [Candidatus Dependentiae bacterium]
MKNERTQYKVDIFGEQYVLVSDESAELVINTARCVDSLMKEIATKNNGIDTKKIAVLVALQLASQLVNLKDEKNKNIIQQAHLIDRIEQALNTCA